MKNPKIYAVKSQVTVQNLRLSCTKNSVPFMSFITTAFPDSSGTSPCADVRQVQALTT